MNAFYAKDGTLWCGESNLNDLATEDTHLRLFGGQRSAINTPNWLRLWTG